MTTREHPASEDVRNVTDAQAEFERLIPSLKPVLRKFQRFSTSERYRMLG